jgi:hypothetical protein
MNNEHAMDVDPEYKPFPCSSRQFALCLNEEIRTSFVKQVQYDQNQMIHPNTLQQLP